MTLPDAIATSSFFFSLAIYYAFDRYCEMKEYNHRHSRDYQE